MEIPSKIKLYTEAIKNTSSFEGFARFVEEYFKNHPLPGKRLMSSSNLIAYMLEDITDGKFKPNQIDLEKLVKIAPKELVTDGLITRHIPEKEWPKYRETGWIKEHAVHSSLTGSQFLDLTLGYPKDLFPDEYQASMQDEEDPDLALDIALERHFSSKKRLQIEEWLESKLSNEYMMVHATVYPPSIGVEKPISLNIELVFVPRVEDSKTAIIEGVKKVLGV